MAHAISLFSDNFCHTEVPVDMCVKQLSCFDKSFYGLALSEIFRRVYIVYYYFYRLFWHIFRPIAKGNCTAPDSVKIYCYIVRLLLLLLLFGWLFRSQEHNLLDSLEPIPTPIFTDVGLWKSRPSRRPSPARRSHGRTTGTPSHRQDCRQNPHRRRRRLRPGFRRRTRVANASRGHARRSGRPTSQRHWSRLWQRPPYRVGYVSSCLSCLSPWFRLRRHWTSARSAKLASKWTIRRVLCEWIMPDLPLPSAKLLIWPNFPAKPDPLWWVRRVEL